MNSADEEFAFKIFLELHGELPTGEKSVCPDFVINHNGKKIGVELIELMENISQPFSSAAKYSLEDKIAKSDQRQFDLISNKKLMVNLQIVENLNLPQHKINYLASQIVDILTNTINDKPYVLSHNLEIIENLPKQIVNIYYDITPFLTESHFSVMRSKWTGSFNLNDLNRSIGKKENNVKTYRKNVDLIYLLIIEGFTFSSYLGPFEKKGNIINNSFDKIFLLKVMSRELFEIK
jgi:hypothetical protein